MNLYDEICRELTIFENNEDKEMTSSDWNDVFYHLLVMVQNAIDTYEEIEDFKKDYFKIKRGES